MRWQQIAAIYTLSVMIGGLISVGILLWIKRDRPRRRAPRRLDRFSAEATERRRIAVMANARRRMEAQVARTARCRHGNVALSDGSCSLDSLAAGGWSGDVLSQRDLDILRDCSEDARATLAGDKTRTCPECGGPWAQPSPDCPHRLWNLHPKARPQLTASERLAAWYSAREEAQTQQLLDAGAARWH